MLRRNGACLGLAGGETFKWSRKSKPGDVRGRHEAAEQLFALNDRLKHKAMEEKGFWALYKDAHPLNRWNYQSWEKSQIKESIWVKKMSDLPTDQKQRRRRALMMANPGRFVFIFMAILYTGVSYLRYSFFGWTPQDGGVMLTKAIFGTPRIFNEPPSPF